METGAIWSENQSLESNRLECPRDAGKLSKTAGGRMDTGTPGEEQGLGQEPA